MAMFIKITNDSGTGLGTRVLNEAGDDIGNMLGIESLNISIPSVNDLVRATLTIGLVKTEIEPGVVDWVVRHPTSLGFEKITGITFANGDVLHFESDGSVNHYPEGKIVRVQPLATGRSFIFRAAPVDGGSE